LLLWARPTGDIDQQRWAPTTNFNILHVWLENAYARPPKLGFSGDLTPLLGNNINVTTETVTCGRDEETNRQIDMFIKKFAEKRVFTHAQIRNGRIDSNQILHIDSQGGRSNIFGMTSKLASPTG